MATRPRVKRFFSTNRTRAGSPFHNPPAPSGDQIEGVLALLILSLKEIKYILRILPSSLSVRYQGDSMRPARGFHFGEIFQHSLHNLCLAKHSGREDINACPFCYQIFRYVPSSHVSCCAKASLPIASAPVPTGINQGWLFLKKCLHFLQISVRITHKGFHILWCNSWLLFHFLLLLVGICQQALIGSHVWPSNNLPKRSVRFRQSGTIRSVNANGLQYLARGDIHLSFSRA